MKQRLSQYHASSDPGLTVDRLRAFVSQGAVFQVRMIGVKRGFSLLVHLRTGLFWLHTEKSKKPRVFSRADTAFRLLKDVGLRDVAAVDLSGWVFNEEV